MGKSRCLVALLRLRLSLLPGTARNSPERGGYRALTEHRCSHRRSVLPVYLGLVAQNRVQKRAMNLDLSIVADEAKLTELIHEKANP
jgi:hypothetical protein